MIWLVDGAGGVAVVSTRLLLDDPELLRAAWGMTWCFFRDQAFALSRERRR